MKKMKKINEESEIISKNNYVCCGVLEKISIKWMKLENGDLCTPYLVGLDGNILYRVNYCPSCGKYIRDVIIHV